MNALSVRLQELEGRNTEKFPFFTSDLDDLVSKKMKDNLDNKDLLYWIFKWDYARKTLTYETFIAALAVTFLAEKEFIGYHKNESWAFAVGVGTAKEIERRSYILLNWF
jgi:hypothetical protein